MKTNYSGHDDVYKKRLASGARGWDTSANGYELRIEKLQKVLSRNHAPQSGKLLELGCGTGVIGLWFASLGFSVSGIDISPTAIHHANIQTEEVQSSATFHIGDVISLEVFEDDSFDFIYDSHLLHCIIGDDRQQMLKNVHRVLKPNGYLLIDTMCYSDKTLTFPHFDSKSNYTISPSGIATRYIGEEHVLIKEIKDAGFNIYFSNKEYYPDGDCLIIEATKT
ncbi:MAG: class I SAM-dependent methyltransferase [Lentisphaeraceae bacterium]|nr:class I SAM-dependent methyltransferase [Lentisphaeraceae bacterium]